MGLRQIFPWQIKQILIKILTSLNMLCFQTAKHPSLGLFLCARGFFIVCLGAITAYHTKALFSTGNVDFSEVPQSLCRNILHNSTGNRYLVGCRCGSLLWPFIGNTIEGVILSNILQKNFLKQLTLF